MSVTSSIYALTDPTTKEIRYIGKAMDANYRFKKHIEESKRKATSHKHKWLRSLFAENKIPELLILDTVFTADANFWERFYILEYRKLGCKLTNHTDGGDGGAMSPDVIEKIRQHSLGRKASLLQKQTISTIMKGNKYAAGNTNQRKTVFCFDGIRFICFESSRHAADEFGLLRTSVNNNVNGRSKLVKQKYSFYKW